MKLTDVTKALIDDMEYHSLLRRWRRAPDDDPMRSGETGKYMARRMEELREEPGGWDRHEIASRAVGWEGMK